MLVSQDYPYLRIRLSVRNFRSRMRAMVDTGFDGDIVLPHNVKQLHRKHTANDR